MTTMNELELKGVPIVTADEPKICKTCKHAITRDYEGVLMGSSRWRCRKTGTVNPVDGTTRFRDCGFVREDIDSPRTCGKSGAWWEPWGPDEH